MSKQTHALGNLASIQRIHTRKDFLKLAAVAGLGLALAGLIPAALATSAASPETDFSGETLTVHYWSGAEGDNIQQAVTDPFMAETGAQVVVDFGDTSVGIAKLRAQKSDPQIDVAMMDDRAIFTLAPEDVLTKLDFDKIPNAKDLDPRFVILDGYGVGVYTFVLTLMYNTDCYDAPPTSWEELWNPELEGKVSIQGSEQSNFITLIIATAHLTGGDQYNTDAVWDKLRELKPNVHSITSNYAVTSELFRTGEICLALGDTVSYGDAIARGYPIAPSYELEEGFQVAAAAATIPKGHPGDQELAELFVNMLLDPESQERMAAGLVGPTNTQTVISDPQVAAGVMLPEHFGNVMDVDLEHLDTVVDEWRQRYDEIFLG